MDKWVVIASGPSLTICDVEKVVKARAEGKIKGIIGTNNCMIDFPCDVGVAYDRAWIDAYWDEVKKFSGQLYSRTEWRNKAKPVQIPLRSANSGLVAMFVARDFYKASQIILLGFDMGRDDQRGHYFGEHTRKSSSVPLRNSNEKIFQLHIGQFGAFNGCEVINCSRKTRLTQFPIYDLEQVLNG